MSALNAALYRRGIILWLAAVLLLASRSTHSAPVYDQDTTQIAEYDGVTAGCYFNYQRYQEGDRIMTSEPCLNCTCHNRMLMCYLKVCPFTKAIGQDCTVEKRPDQCCPVITCPEVPVQLLTSTTSAPAISDSTEIGFHDNYGCHVDERFYADGAMLPLDHHNPCELCYCIRNRTTCVMQECTLRVAGCKPVYQSGVCCPIKYNCEYDEEPSTTVGPGLIMTTTLPPGVLPQCYYEGKVYEDGDLIYSTQPCQHCYCFRGEIACAVQNCGTPMQAHGKNCTALPPPEGECCPTTYQCEEGITTVQDYDEEQFPEQVPHDQITESPVPFDQEDQQVKKEHPQEEIFPGIDNTVSHAQEEEDEKNVQGTIEHITQGHIPSTEKSGEEPATLPAEEIETTTIQKESIPSHEHVTETSPVEMTSKVGKMPSEVEAIKPEMSTTVQGAEESLVTEAPATELLETSSIAESLRPEEEMLTTEHVPEKHVSTEENIVEKEYSTTTTEKGQGIETSISETIQTEGPKEEETTNLHEELSTKTQEEIEEQRTTEEDQISVTKIPEKPEISTEIIENTTLSTEEPSISTVSESISEQPKEHESKPDTTPGEFLATQTESPKEKETVTVTHEISSTEQIITEKEEVSYPTETVVTEEIYSTEVSGPSKEQSIEKQKVNKDEKEQQPENTTSEHAIEEQVTVGAKKEDAGLTESPLMSEESVITKDSHVEDESTPEIPVQGPTGIPIPERSPEQKAEDENVYHVTKDHHGVTHPEISPDNLITESPQKTSTIYLPQEQETLTSSEEIAKPIVPKDTEVSTEEVKPLEQTTEINLPTQHKPEITTISEEMKTESIPIVIEVQGNTESSATTITQEIPEEETSKKSGVPETKIPPTEIQLTEKIPSDEKGEKEVQPKKEDEMRPPIATEFVSETSTFIPREHLTMPSDLGKEHATEDEHITTVIPLEQSTHFEEKKTEIIPAEKRPITEKPFEEHVTEHPIVIPDITGEQEKELQTEGPVLKEQTTEAIKVIEIEEKSTTQIPVVEKGITEQPEQFSTEKALEEATVTESHSSEETEYTKGISTESAEQQTTITITEKISSGETIESKPTEVIHIEETELPVEHSTEPSESEKQGEEKISVSTEKVQTEIPALETGATEITETVMKTEKMQTESSVSEEYVPSQPSIPSDRKEDQGSIESNEEQITQKLEPTVSSVEEIPHIPTSESAVSESVSPKEPAKGTMESAGVDVAITSEQPEIPSEQPEKITTEPSGQEEQTQEQMIEEQPEMHERKEIETSSPITHEESSVIPEILKKPVESEENVDVNKTGTNITESGSTTIPVVIPEASTELPGFEEPTKHEISIEKEITSATESISSEKEQPGIQEQVTQPSIKEETPSKKEDETKGPTEISTEKGITLEIPKVSITKEPHNKSEEEEVIKETGIMEMPDYEGKEEYSTYYSNITPKETTKITITTEIPPKKISQYTTNIPEEISVEGESTLEIASRPFGIPGEGNCLVEGQSYSNNSAVPPANVCQTTCRCISSIVQCELVQCPAPPIHLSNCMPVHKNGESCCPTYACDSTPIAELESDSHVVEPHIPGEEETQRTVPPSKIPTEIESSTLVAEISTPELRPVETVTPSEEEIAIERQPTTLKPIETVYEQPTTIRQPIEQYPEKHTISPTSDISQESVSQIPEEEHTMSEKTTESKINKEDITESVSSTEQPQEKIGEKQVTVNGEIITSTYASMEPHDIKEIVTVSTITMEKETSIPVEVQEVSISTKKEEVSTIAADKAEETITPAKEQEKSTEEEGIAGQTTLKPTEGIEKEQPEEKVPPLKSTPKESVIVEEHETSTKSEEIMTEKSEIPEEQETIKPTENTSIPEIQLTTDKPEIETEYKEDKEQETLTETTETEELENQTKLPHIAPSEIEIQKPISTFESTTLIHDHTVSEGVPIEEYTTIKSVEVFTEENMKTELPTQAPAIEEEHVIIPVLSIETESSKETTKLIEESIPEVSHKEILPVTTESTIEKETTKHVEKHIEHEGEPSITKSSEEKPFETGSPINTEEPTKTIEIDKTTEAEYEKPTETNVVYSTQVSIEKHSEATSEFISHTSELPTEEYTIAKEITTTSAAEEEIGELATTSIIKETESSLSEIGTKQPVIPKSETPVIEPVTTPVEEQTSKSKESPVEEQTIASPSSNEEKITESSVSTEVAMPVTSQEEQTTEKAIENINPETQSSDLAEEHTVIPEISKKDEEQKPEIEITREPSKEKPTTIPELTEVNKEDTEEAVTEKAMTPVSTTEYKQEEIEPMKTTTIQTKPEKDSQITEASSSEHPVSEEVTTVPDLIFEEHPNVSVKTEEQSSHELEYQTTLPTAEEVSKSTETNEVEKEETVESTEKLEESVTTFVTKLEVSSTEKSEKIPSEIEKSVEKGTEASEQGETTTKIIENAVINETLPEEIAPIEVIPKIEEKPTEISATEEEEAHFTEPTSIETTSVHEEEQPSITKLQPSESSHPFEEETSVGEIQPSQPEESEEAHSTISESHPSVTEEPQFTTEHAPEELITIKIKEQPETSSETVATVEGPTKVSDMKPSNLPEETATVGSAVAEEPESQIPMKSEESPQPETPIEEPIIKTQPISTELPTGEITEEIPEEEPIHPQEGEGQPHFPETTLKSETDYNFHEQRPATTLAPHIPDYPDQTGISGEDTHFPMPGGSYPNPDDDYGEDDYGGPGTCRYGGKVYVSAQQIPRDDPCDFCFCFRSDIICLQQSCPPPIPGCHEEPISGFCCPRYECPVSMATALNLTTTTTTTTTTLPPHFPAHAYKGAARRSGCQVRGQAYRVGEIIKSASGPCLRCVCGGDGNMNCDPRVCSPEPMLRQMIAATTDAKRRR